MLRTGQTRSGGLRAAGDVLRCAGGFPAWVVGSVFATVLDFFNFFDVFNYYFSNNVVVLY